MASSLTLYKRREQSKPATHVVNGAGLLVLTIMFALFAALPMTASAQSPDRMYRLGHLASTVQSFEGTRRLALPELAKQGFIEGQNLVIDSRFGTADELPILMRQMLAAKPDAIITVGGVALRIAREATGTVPIVSFGPHPVELGYAASLARPGGNVTGVVILGPELDAKRLHLMHEAAPGARPVAVLFPGPSPSRSASERAMHALAASAGIELLAFSVVSQDDYPGAFAAMRAAGAQALVISTAPQFDRDIAKLAALALEARLPTICEWARNARDGCLFGYGPDAAALRRRVADQVARIFRGAAPGELPIEEPTAFEFAINLKTAKALGLTVAPALLARADEVIE